MAIIACLNLIVAVYQYKRAHRADMRAGDLEAGLTGANGRLDEAKKDIAALKERCDGLERHQADKLDSLREEVRDFLSSRLS